jgi:hypothetical protein
VGHLTDRRPPRFLAGTCVRIASVESLGADDQSRSVLGELGVVIDSAKPVPDGSRWNLGVWIPKIQELWGFEEQELESTQHDEEAVADAHITPENIGLPWLDAIVVSLWTKEVLDRDRVASYLRRFVGGVTVKPSKRHGLAATVVAYPSQHPAELLRQHLERSDFGRWEATRDDGWDAEFSWLRGDRLIGLTDTTSIEMASLDITPYEHPRPRPWRFPVPDSPTIP